MSAPRASDDTLTTITDATASTETTSLRENIVPRDTVQPTPNLDRGNSVAPLPAASNFASWAARLRLDDRTTPRATVINLPIILVPINFENARKRVHLMLSHAMRSWIKLEENIPLPTILRDKKYILNRCRDLSCAFVHLLWWQCRTNISKYHQSAFKIYTKRSSFDRYKEVPTFLTHLVYQFGHTQAAEFFGNNRYLHHWDHENENTFGIDPEINAKFDSAAMTSFIDLLSTIGVKIGKWSPDSTSRTFWDSLQIQEANGYVISTTYPMSHYNLPADCFIQMLFNGPTFDRMQIGLTAEIGPTTTYYHPRGEAIRDEKLVKRLATEPLADVTYDEALFDSPLPPLAKKRKTIPASMDAPDDASNTTPAAFLRFVTETGISVIQEQSKFVIDPTSKTPSEKEVYLNEIYVFGRGGWDRSWTIKTVFNGLRRSEIIEAYESLVRYGP